MPKNTQVRRQARGQRRIAEILDAAAVVFAASGYAGATTNAIAAQAGISPGSLYQFFPNKEAIAEALATRFQEQMRGAHAAAFDTAEVADLTLDDLLDRMIDPIVAFNVANPGLKALFANTDMPAGLAEATRSLQATVSRQVEAVIAARAPELPAAQRARCALVSVQIVRALMPPVVAARGRERDALVAELKRALHGYLSSAIEIVSAGS